MTWSSRHSACKARPRSIAGPRTCSASRDPSGGIRMRRSGGCQVRPGPSPVARRPDQQHRHRQAPHQGVGHAAEPEPVPAAAAGPYAAARAVSSAETAFPRPRATSGSSRRGHGKPVRPPRARREEKRSHEKREPLSGIAVDTTRSPRIPSLPGLPKAVKPSPLRQSPAGALSRAGECSCPIPIPLDGRAAVAVPGGPTRSRRLAPAANSPLSAAPGRSAAPVPRDALRRSLSTRKWSSARARRSAC